MNLPITVYIKSFPDLYGKEYLHAYEVNEGGNCTEYVRRDVFDAMVRAAILEAKKNGEKPNEPYEHT